MSESISDPDDSPEPAARQTREERLDLDQEQARAKLSREEIRSNVLADQLAEVRKQLEETRLKLELLRHQALIDTLTEVGNRRAMEQTLDSRFNELVRYGHAFSMLVIDLDRLKAINDTHGHSAGDEVIKRIAERMCQLLRRSDIVFRIGGDEFIVLLPGTDGRGAKHTADRLCKSIAELVVPFENGNLQTTISIGVSQATKEDEPRVLYDRADKLLYLAKEAGGNRSALDENEFDADQIEQVSEE